MHVGRINIVLILAALYVCIFLNNDIPTVNNMEARNYITAREILADGSWLLPTMNGELRIAKPPVPTWITALVMKWRGTDADLRVNRIPAGICGALLVLFTFLLVRRTTGDRELAATAMLVLATGLLFFWSARRNFWDIYAHTAMAGAVWTMVEILMRRKGKGRYFLVFSFFMAFSFFSKGPVALWAMFIPFLVSYCMVYGVRDLKKNIWVLVLGMVLAVLFSASWPVYVYLNTPHDALAVASKETSNWFTYHAQAPWYYLLNLHWVAGLWLFFLLYAVIAPFAEKNWRDEEKLFVYWFVLILLFLSVIPEKKVRYLLPAIVPGAVISAVAVFNLRDSAGRAWKAVYGPFCIIAGILFMAAGGVLVIRSPEMLVAAPGAVVLTVLGILIISGLIRKKTRNTHLLVVTGVCLCIVLVTPLKPEILARDDARMLMSLREKPRLVGKKLYFLGDLPVELVWAAGRKIQAVDAGQVKDLEMNGSSAVVITTEAMGENCPGMCLVDSIPTRDKVYYVYSALNDKVDSDKKPYLLYPGTTGGKKDQTGDAANERTTGFHQQMNGKPTEMYDEMPSG